MSENPNDPLSGYKEEIRRLKRLFEESHIQFQCLDNKGTILDVNPAWLKVLGYSREEVLGKSFIGFLDLESSKKFDKHFSDKLFGDKKGLELTLLCRDGSSMFTEFSCISTQDTGNGRDFTYCVFKNITRLRQVEKALEESETRYHRLVELSNVGIYELDPQELEFTYVNDVIKRVFGEKRIEKDGFWPERFMDGEERIRFRQRIEKLLAGEDQSSSEEYYLKKPDGESICVQISNSYVQDENGRMKIIGVAQDITERKELETKLQAYFNRFEQINQNLPCILFQYTYVEGVVDFLYVSEKIKDLLGYSSEEAMSNPDMIASLIDHSDYQNIVETVGDAVAKNQPASLQFRIRGRNQQFRWIRTIISRRILENGMDLYTGISNDITEEVKLKEKLEQTEQKYKALVNSAAPGISTMSKEGVVMTVNPRLCEISGYSEEELVGKNFMRIPAFYAKDLKSYMKLYKNALIGKLSPEPVRFEWRHKSGDHRWGEGHLSAIRENGRVVAYQAVMVDITYRVHLEQKELERREELNYLFESACGLLAVEREADLFEFLADRVYQLIPKAIVVVNSLSEDFKTLIVEAVRFADTGKYRKAKKLLENVVEGRAFQANEDLFKHALSGRLQEHNKTLYELTLHQIPERICKQVEKIIDLDVIYEISLSTHEHIIGGAAILLPMGTDLISKDAIELLFREASAAVMRIRSRRKQEEAVSRKNKLYSILSHDLTSPFNSQLGFLQLLHNKYDVLSDEERKDYIQNIRSSSEKIFELLHSILQWTVGHEASEELYPESVRLHVVVQKTMALYQEKADSLEINLCNRVESETHVFADYNMVFTVLRNLISNAIKFSEHGGEIEVSASEETEMVHCKVRDDGRGIKKEKLAALAGQMVRTTTTGQNGEQGHGLGLKFCRDLIQSCGGEMKVRSEFGKGTEVEFSLPKQGSSRK